MSTRSRVVTFEGAYAVAAIHEVTLPAPGPGQVEVLMYAAGVGRRQLDESTVRRDEPALAGTEGSGRVTAVGQGVAHVQVGDLVFLSPGRAYVGEERPAAIDLPGGTIEAALWTWATNVVVDAAHAFALPAVKDREAAAVLGETAWAAVAATANVKAGESAAVFGCGGAGLALVGALRSAGAEPIVAIDRDDARLERAAVLGATHVVNAPVKPALGQLAALVPEGVDHVFDVLAEYAAKSRPGRAALKAGGRAWLLGAPGTVEAREAFEQARTDGGYEAVPAGAHVAARVIEAVADGALDPSALIGRRYTIEAVNEALRDLENGDLPGAAIIVMEPLE